MRHYDQLHESDPDLANALADEVARQQETLTLIASENHASQSVLTARAAFSPTNTRKATRTSGTMRGASMLTKSNNLQSLVRRISGEPST
jgi:glycine/serine hydroxymethyltransferase